MTHPRSKALATALLLLASLLAAAPTALARDEQRHDDQDDQDDQDDRDDRGSFRGEDDDQNNDQRTRHRRRNRRDRQRRGRPDEAAPPPAHVGIQVAIRLGFAVPLGELRGGIPISSAIGISFPVIVDVGVKLTPHLFIGGYARAAAGPTGARMTERCDAEGGLCLAFAGGIGALAQYHFIPAGSANPWLGLGIGASALSGGAYTDFDTYNIVAMALDFATVSTGVDFRLKRKLGLGPFVEVGGGTYLWTQERGRFAPLGTVGTSASIYVAITAGIRLVVNP